METKQDWNNAAQIVCQYYNSKVHNTTGETPSYVFSIRASQNSNSSSNSDPYSNHNNIQKEVDRIIEISRISEYISEQQVKYVSLFGIQLHAHRYLFDWSIHWFCFYFTLMSNIQKQRFDKKKKTKTQPQQNLIEGDEVIVFNDKRKRKNAEIFGLDHTRSRK